MKKDKKRQPLVSVCCITYNHEKYVAEAIESIWIQNYHNMEIIVIDDGSRDDSYKILKALAKKSPYSMSVETQINSGRIGYNLNKALKKAKGDYIMFLSLDDKFIPGSVNKLIDIVVDDPSLQFVCPDRTIGIDNNSEELEVIKSPMFGKTEKDIKIEDLFKMEMIYGQTFYIQSAIFRKDIIDKVGGFDDDLTGDDIVLRAKIGKYMIEHNISGYEIVSFPTFYYRTHEGNIHLNKERQILIISEVSQRYYDGYCPVLKEWILWTSVHYIKKGLSMIFDPRVSLMEAFLYYIKRFFQHFYK